MTDDITDHEAMGAMLYRGKYEERGMNGWRPIETAPEDGTHVLLWATRYSMLCPKSEMIVGRYCRGWWGSNVPLSHVMYWMPLPEPPCK